MYVRVLSGAGEFGIYTNIYGWVALLLVILTYGMETGFFRFINKKEEKEPVRVYATALFSVGCTSLLFILSGFAVLHPVSRALGYAGYPEYLGMMIVVVGMDAFCAIPFAYLRYRGRPVRFAVLKLVNIGLNIGLNLFFFILAPRLIKGMPDYGVGYVFMANVITTAVTFLLLLPDTLPAFRCKPDWVKWKQMLRYSFPILLLGVAGIFNQTADKILFPFLFEDREYATRQLGIYGACFRMAAVMVMFIQAFRYAYEPFIFSRNREEGSLKAYVLAMKYFIIFGLVIFLGVMFYMDILKYFITPAYYPGLRVVPVVMLGELFFGIYFNLSLWYKLTDRTCWGAWFSVSGCVVTVLMIVFLAPVYGYMACAWASFCCNLFMMLLSYVVGQKKFPVPYDVKSAFTYFAAAAALYAAGMLPPIASEPLRLAYRTFLLTAFLLFIFKKERFRAG
jgi:O-antigen/teichoic acid export membrane protein